MAISTQYRESSVPPGKDAIALPVSPSPRIMTDHRSSFLIGIDTGGTYTDAAVIAAEDHRVVSSAKALTTRGDLAIGVAEAMAGALQRLDPAGKAAISLVSVSTTLATNAVVEGHGGLVCVILIGFDH